MRLFVAVWPPSEVVEVLAAMGRPVVEGVRWTAPAQWHVTLRFLGEVDDAAGAAAEDVLRDVATRLEPATAVVGDRVERFGRAVAYVRIDGLRSWAAAVAEAFGVAAIGPHRPDDREFRGHVTVARARGRVTVGPLAGSPLPPGRRTWTATELALVRSRLRAVGAEYTDLAVVPVGPR